MHRSIFTLTLAALTVVCLCLSPSAPLTAAEVNSQKSEGSTSIGHNPLPGPPPECEDFPSLSWRCFHASAQDLSQVAELLEESLCLEVVSIAPFRTQRDTTGVDYVTDYVVLATDVDYPCTPL